MAPAALRAATVSPPPATDKQFPGLRIFSRCLRNFDSSLVEWLDLERSDRTIPEQGLGTTERGNHVLDTAGSEIEDHVLFCDIVRLNNARCRMRSELFRYHGIDGKQDLTAARVGRAENLARRPGKIGLAERLSNPLALGKQERVRHGPPNNQYIDLVEKIAQQIQF